MRKLLCILLVLVSTFTKLSSQEKEQNTKGNWDDYYENTLNDIQPCDNFLLALSYFKLDQKIAGVAVDLGAGTGRDTLYLLKSGWQVLAIDAEPLAIEILLRRAEEVASGSLEVAVSSFSTMALPENVDLINASYSLPFCAAGDFYTCWQTIVDSLAIGGRFTGQFFGDRDEWSTLGFGTFHSHEEVLELFRENFAIEYIQIEEGLKPTADGEMKQWHIFHVVAKKIK